MPLSSQLPVAEHPTAYGVWCARDRSAEKADGPCPSTRASECSSCRGTNWNELMPREV